MALHHDPFDTWAQGLWPGFGRATRPRRQAEDEGPPINVWHGEEGVVLSLATPGVDPAQVEVTVHGDTLTLAGPAQPEPEGAAEPVRAERRTGPWKRQVRLSFEPDPDKVMASLTRGVLRVSLPRPHADRPHRIGVTTRRS